MVDISIKVWQATAAVCAAMSLAACTGGVHSSGSSGGTSSEPQYTVGGTVTGLAGSGLVLASNTGETVNVSGDGAFSFKTTFPDGSPYYVLVLTQPGTPTQTCVATNGSGTLQGSNVTGITVACKTKTAPTDTIGGVVIGLTGSGLVLQNGSDTVAVTANGAFVFPTALPSGAQYSVSVLTPPIEPYEDCAVLNGKGTTDSSDVTNIGVVCTVNSRPTHTISGRITGVSGTIVLENNGRDDLTITADGAFKFPLGIPSGSSYDVTTKSAAGLLSQACTFANAAGMVGDSDITNVTITCTANAGLTATVSGLAGTGLTLQNTSNGDSVPVTANGTVVFPASVGNGKAYNVAVSAQPSNPTQTCVVGNGTGTEPETTVVTVTCTTNTYTVGGVVNGLPDPQAANSSTPPLNLVLLDSAGDTITIPPTSTSPVAFTFPTPIASGGRYSVSIQAQPGVDYSGGSGLQTSSVCVVSGGGSGTVTNANVVNIAITCVRPAGFAYVTNSTDNTVSPYLIDGDTGALLPSGPPASTGTFPTSAVMAPTGSSNGTNLLYVANGGSSDVSSYTIDPNTGSLAPVAGSPFTVSGSSAPSSIAAPPPPPPTANSFTAGDWLYTTDIGGHGLGTIAAASYNGTSGVLTDIAGTPFPTGFSPTSAQFLAGGNYPTFLNFLLEIDGSTLSSFVVNATTGAPQTPAAGSAATGNAPTSMAGLAIFVPTQEAYFDYAYVVNSGDGTLSSYQVNDQSGTVNPLVTTPLESGASAVTVAGNYEANPNYVFASSPHGVWGFSAANDGTLTALPGNPAAAGTSPGPLTANDQHVYVVNTTDETITGYSIQGPNLSLAPITGPVVKTGHGPTSIIVIPRPSIGPVG